MLETVAGPVLLNIDVYNNMRSDVALKWTTLLPDYDVARKKETSI